MATDDSGSNGTNDDIMDVPMLKTPSCENYRSSDVFSMGRQSMTT